LGNGPAVRGLLALQKKEDPDILFLSETKLKGKKMEKFRNMLGLQHMLVKDCVGKSGGLALFWRRGINVELRWMGRMHIDVNVTEEDGFKWRLTGIYGEPRQDRREETWRLMRTLHHQSNLPWLCVGDFNEIMFNYEKQGGVPRPQICMDRFRDALLFCNLNDLGFEGDIFTWRNNNHRVEGYIRERLDRAVANPSWRARFPCYKVVNGCPEHSDHRPVIISVNGARRGGWKGGGLQNKRFEARWLLEEDCDTIVNNAWDVAKIKGCKNTADLLKSVSGELHTWSREVLGDMQKRVKKLKTELEDCRKKSLSQEMVNREQVIRFKLGRLEEQLDIYWRQRAHVQWLEKGDRNTHYFHSCASERKKNNTIHKLKGEDGVEVKGEENLKALVTNYFVSLFTPMAGIDIRHALSHIPTRVTAQMNEILQADYTEEEIKKALDSMGDLKAPGADGMPALFFKRYWSTVGEQVVKEVLHVLRGGSIPEGWNDTIVVLIPKVQNPDKLKDLRPISLCNVVYKLISKVLANRLKIILGDLISPNQSAFVPGRLISDNTILAYEMSHFMRKKRRGGKNYMALKLDMSKAYDRVEWPFLKGVMEKLGFCGPFIDLIMKCVSSVSYRFKINGELTDLVLPGRGLRQGDPISPYLFLLCAEGFSGLLHHADEVGKIKGIRLAPSAPAINHLLFADDSLLLMEANLSSADAVNRLLQIYEESSGQQINRDKSSVSFSPNTPRHVREDLMHCLGLRTEAHGGKYLGLPLYVGRSKSACFEYLKDKIWRRIQGWKEKFLSSAGKEILIKAVAQAIPTYAMACFDLTKSLCDSISKMVCRYWWSQQDNENRIHWVSWEKMKLPKADGGLGFRDLHSFNMAMLARQGWRLVQAPDSLCSRVLKAKYFPTGDVLSAVASPGMSYVWRSILKGIQLLKEGLIWRVGDGTNIKIWQDPWVPKDFSRRPSTLRGRSILTRVSELIDPISESWDMPLVQQSFAPDDARIIISIPIVEQSEDYLAWHLDKKGVF
jgi:exonuclease III/phage terminase Nu1 subunit (DNA packaging protein)